MKMKRFARIIFCLVIVVLFLTGGSYLARKGYESARQTRLLTQARGHIAKSESKEASLCLQRALQYNPKDVEACRLMADLSEENRSPAALLWRSRVVDLSPESVGDRLALAQTAVTFRDYISATNALSGISESGKRSAPYHNLAGGVALAANEFAEAENHFAEASRIDEQNAVPKLNLAVVRLHRTNAMMQSEARITLKQLAANPTNSSLRCMALRELIVDAMRYQRTNEALAISQELAGETNAAFSDRLLRLQVLRRSQDPKFKTVLNNVQREAAGSPKNVFELAMWQMANVPLSETLAWLISLPISMRTNQSVALLIAQSYTKFEDWQQLQTWVEQQNWGEVEFLRHAFKARALRGQDLTTASKTEWEQAIKAAMAQKLSQIVLLRLAASWNWQNEAEGILWGIYNNHPTEKWVLPALGQALLSGGKTRQLLALYRQEQTRSPLNISAKNNLAMTALLLDAKELRPHDLAREVYLNSPTNSAYASTYAFSLHLQGKNSDALKVMQTLKPQELENPSIAGYYALILKSAGLEAEAKRFLDLITNATLLPEERTLFERTGDGA